VGVYKQNNSSNSTGNMPNTTLYKMEQKALEMLQSFSKKSSSEIKLYPNPTSGLVNIQYELTQNVRLEVKDITGRILMQILMPAGKVESTIDLTALADGIYIYNFFVGNEIKKIGKLLKY
jgi:hypothetical protein